VNVQSGVIQSVSAPKNVHLHQVISPGGVPQPHESFAPVSATSSPPMLPVPRPPTTSTVRARALSAGAKRSNTMAGRPAFEGYHIIFYLFLFFLSLSSHFILSVFVMHKCMYIYIYMYMYIHIHICICICIYTSICSFNNS